MMGVCGLALSSFFVINNQKLVHADSLDSGAAAMSFDDDSASNNSAIKADDSVQNKSVASNGNTSNAQDLQSSNLNCEQNNNNSAQVHYNADSGMQRSNVQDNSMKVTRVDATMQNSPVTITNPANSTVHVHNVKTNGTSAGVGDYNIKLNNQGSQSYNVPNDYNLLNPNSKYSVGSTRYMGTVASGSGGSIINPSGNYAVANVNGSFKSTPVHISDPSSNRIYVNFVSTNGQAVGRGNYWIDLSNSSTGTYQIPSGYQLASGNGKYLVEDNTTSKQVAKIRKYEGNWRDTSFTPEEIRYIQNHCTDGPVDDMDFVVSSKTTAMICAHNGYLTEEAMSGRANPESQRIINKLASYVPRPTGKTAARGAGNQGEILITNKTVHHYKFNDNSGSVLSHSGNTVNVVLTKPQNVDPATNSRLNAEAVRTIKINFPGSIPLSYRNIVDDRGVLTQIVKFTRTAMEDGLTGNLIESSIGPWQSNNSDPNFLGFPERTLPRIPGYTLSIKPA